MIKLSATLAEDAKRVQKEMKSTMEQMAVYRDRTESYQTWYEASSQTPGLTEPVGSETSIIKRQLHEVEVSYSLIDSKSTAIAVLG